VQAEYILAGDHHVDVLGELMHHDAFCELANLDCEDKTSWCEVVYILSQVAVLRDLVDLQVLLQEEDLESIH
jgi:hypothetical protein